MTIHISCCTSDNLEEGSLRAEKSDLFSIEDTYKRCLRQIESFTQEIHPDDNIDLSEPIFTEYLEPFYRLDL